MTPLVLAALLGAADAQAQAEAVEKALVIAEPKLHRCWEKAAADDWRVEGQIALRVVVGADGKAGKVAIQADSIGKKPLEDCVAQAFGDVSFGGAFAPGDSVEVPVTFKAESNVTLKADDVKSTKLVGAQGMAKVLVDPKTAGADGVSMVWIDLQPGSRWVRPTPQGKAFIYVKRGRSTVGGQPVTDDDVVVLDDGAAPMFQVSGRSELVVLFVPGGAEQAIRDGKRIPPPTDGPAPKIIKLNDSHRYDILGGKGSAWIYHEGDKAAVDHLRIDAGATVPEHQHDGSAELLYFTTGSGELVVDGEKYPVAPYTAVYVPPSTKHSFTAGDRRVEAIQFYTPSGPEQRFKGSAK